MADTAPFEPPAVSDSDIRWVSRLLGLSDDAFYGEDGSDPRQLVLKYMEPTDVAACPGSGKTTLLVAKLAILAEKWQYRTRGICVLSHTNAARNEIERKLGNTAAGRRLLSYPHFVGTIHGFVNEFIALPWLRSKGYQVKMVDNEVVEERRRNLIEKQGRFSALKVYVKNHEQHQNIVGSWVVSSPDFLVLRNGVPAFSNPGTAATQLRGLVETVVRAGYHRHDEMFMWATNLMEVVPEVVPILRNRFPLLFIDESQDNSEEQSAILHRIFMKGESEVIRQRLGDANQAIFNVAEDTGAKKDVFPDQNTCKVLPNSHRFGSAIAELAGPLALNQYPEGCLEGHGPKRPLESEALEGPHTVFLFDQSSIGRVLGAYAELLVETFSETELDEGSSKGLFVAVGQVHRENKDDNRPRHVGHYWTDYDPGLTRTDPKPQTFVQYVFAGLGKSQVSGETHLAVEKVAEGVLRLAGILQAGGTYYGRHKHRQVLALLEGYDSTREAYERLVVSFVLERDVLTKYTWNSDWCGVVRDIAQTITGISLFDSEAIAFLEWKDGPGVSVLARSAPMTRDNIYRFCKNGKAVSIRVGSIHSVKGETHMATLVLETYWHEHNLESIRDWLLGHRKGYAGPGARIASRLKIHYVAMTRPSYLLCLAMKRTSFEDGKGDLDQTMLDGLKNRGWSDVRLIESL